MYGNAILFDIYNIFCGGIEKADISISMILPSRRILLKLWSYFQEEP